MIDSIERTQSLPLDELNNKYFDRQIPVVIEGIFNKWPAAKWTPEYLAETLGYKIVPVIVMYNGPTWDAHFLLI